MSPIFRSIVSCAFFCGMSLTLSLTLTSQARGDTPPNEKTFFGNGMYAAGFGDVSAATIPGGGDGPGSVAMGASFGWQILRAYGQAITVGYGASAMDGSKSLIHGAEFSLALFNDWPFSVVGTYSPSSGYYRRKQPAEGDDRYVNFTGTRTEARLLVSAMREIKIGVVAGTASVEAEPKYQDETAKDFKGGVFYGLCLRASKM